MFMDDVKKDLFQDVKNILSSTLKVKPEAIRQESNLQDDLGIDSVDYMDIIVTFEKKFGVKISLKEAASLHTLSDLIETLEKKIKKLSG
jgi:acyl carrier protein